MSRHGWIAFLDRSRVIVWILVPFFISCGGAGGGGGSNPVNEFPTASAGVDSLVMERSTVRLQGRGSDLDGRITAYRWEQTEGPPVSLDKADAAVTTFMAPTVDNPVTLTFSLRVTDDKGAWREDTVIITVRPANQPPVVSAGTDREASGGEVVLLSAEAQDSDGIVVSGGWVQEQGTSVVLESVSPQSVRFTAPSTAQLEDLVFRFTAKDDQAAQASDLITIRVAATNFPPVIRRVEVPTQPNGKVAIAVTYDDRNADTLSWQVDYSLDQGTTWKLGSVHSERARPSLFGTQILWWDGLADLGIPPPQPVQLRLRVTDTAGASAASTVNLPLVDNLRAALLAADRYAIYYGVVDAVAVSVLKKYDVVVLHPAPRVGVAGFSRLDVTAIQQGVDPASRADDVIVMCYVAVGEDLRTASLSDAQLRADARFVGDGSGPRVDPRGTAAYTTPLPLNNINPLGSPSPGGVGFASWYVDDNSLAAGVADGLPDRNAVFGGAFVNMADPAWFEAIDAMSSAQGDVPGLREILTTNFGRGLGCDGVFLDAIDMAAPNSFGATKFEWTAPGVVEFINRTRQRYPRALVMQNRGLFFFHPDYLHFKFTTRDSIDALLFESYRLDSDPSRFFDPNFFCDNKRNFMPKVVAQASAQRGFRVFSLGYAEGPADSATGATLQDTLLGRSTYGLDVLRADINEAETVAGFRHYITNGALDLLNDFVLTQSVAATQAPVWSSTFNDQPCQDLNPDVLPTPRVGLQQAVTVPGGVEVQWDVALTPGSVGYILYYQSRPFDFVSADPLRDAESMALTATPQPSYGAGDNRALPFSATVTGLKPGQRYFFLLRTRNVAGGFIEDSNRVVLWAEAGI